MWDFKSFNWKAFDFSNKTLLATGAALLLGGFAVGFLSGRISDNLASNSASVTASGELAKPATGLFGKPRDKNAPRASDVKPGEFTVWKHRINTEGASASACIEFSKPLDPSKTYGDYVVVTPALSTAPAVTVKDSELCVAGLGFNDRRVTLLKGLPSKGSESLKNNADVDFTFGEKPAYAGFVGNGVILPREDGDGVAFETVNISSLKVEVWHVSDRNLVRKSISAPDPVGEGQYDYEWGEDSADDLGVMVWQGNVPVKLTQGERVTTVFPLGSVLKSQKAGAYVVKIRDASGGRDKRANDEPASARRWILFTDMAMTTYRGNNGLDAVVRSLKTAKPLGGVKIALVAQNGDTLSEVRTDANGRVTFPQALMKGTNALSPKMLMAYGASDDFTATDLTTSPMDLTHHGIGGRSDEAVTTGRIAGNTVDSFVYTDRGIYRPGEPVHVVALVRDPTGKSVKDRKGALVITRPSGIEAYRLAFVKTPDGFAAGDIYLPKTAPRGQWRAHLEVEGIEGAAGETTFAVEDFAPQRLGVEVKADAERPLLNIAESRPVTIAARFLYGASGSGLDVSAEARIRADANPFPAYKDYVFGDQSKPYEEQYIDLPPGVTDGAGNALIPFAASQAGVASQPLSVLLTASVFEPGGRPVRDSQTLRIRTNPFYIGVKTEAKDTKYNETPKTGFDIVALTATGTKTPVKGAVVKLIAEHWDYDWYVSDGRWNWRSTHRDVIVSSNVQDIPEAGLHFDKGLDWGDYRLEIEHTATKTKTVVRFSSGWGTPESGAETPDFVRATLGRSNYAQGDTIEIKIKSPYRGEAQVAVATDRLIALNSQTVGDSGDTIRLKTDASWGGGAYVLVTVIQPRDVVNASKPRRAMGMIYVPLEPKSRALKVSIPVSDAPLKPIIAKDGKTYVDVPVHVQGLKMGDKARLSLSVVDQGIVNLTKFKTPNPLDFYFGKRALSVDYNDDYGRLLDPNLGAPVDRFGGDQLGGEGLTTTPIRTTAIWSGVFLTGLDGKTVVRVPISKFNGELKLMAVAWTDDAVGSGDNRLVVREPIVADLALPRFLSPGDKAYATLELNNVDAKDGVYQTVIKGLRGIIMVFDKAMKLVRNDRHIEMIELLAPKSAGVSTISLNMNGQGYAFADQFQIQTRLGWGSVTQTTTLAQGVNEVFAPDGALLTGFAPGTTRVEVSYSPFRGIDPAPLAASLSQYPYGCTEQITSGASAWLYASPSMVGQSKSVPAQSVLKVAVDKIFDRQSEDGAFGLWRVGDSEADGFIGAYATDFILEARSMGVVVSKDGLDRALNAMRELSRPKGFSTVNYRTEVPQYWGYTPTGAKARSEKLQSRGMAYALYVLAKAGSGDVSRLRWYHDVQFKSEESPLARAQVAAGLAMLGDHARARLGFKSAIDRLGYEDQEDWYQTPLRDLAGVIALAYEAGEDEIARSLIPRLERAMKSPDQLNTQEKAFILRAGFYMLKASGPMKLEANGVVNTSGRFTLADLGVTKIKNVGAGALWRTVTVIGVPLNAPPAQSKGLRLERAYYSAEGVRLDPARLTQGQRIIVVISGVNDYAQVRPIVIDDALPAGLEIETTLSNEDTKGGPYRFVGDLSTTQAQEARDDRYIAALTATGNNRFSVAYVARAVTQGDFFLPGTVATDFYRPEVSGRLGASRMVISSR